MHDQLGTVADGAVGNSIGSALAAAQKLPTEQALPIIDAARHAFIHAADVTCLVAAAVTFVGALGALRFLPGRPAVEPLADVTDVDELLLLSSVDEAEVFDLL